MTSGIIRQCYIHKNNNNKLFQSKSSQQQQDNLATALQQLEQYLENFKQREPEFKLTQKIQPIDIAEFQKTLDPKTAIIE